VYDGSVNEVFGTKDSRYKDEAEAPSFDSFIDTSLLYTLYCRKLRYLLNLLCFTPNRE